MAEGEGRIGRIEIRTLADLEEFEATLPLQRRIWGFDEADLVAPRLFGIFARIGGSCLGAYLDGEMVGYSLAFSAVKPDLEPYWHSHMSGVEPDAQNLGVGWLLKLRQREEAMARGIRWIEWTFDPLQARNAHFNIEKLGVDVAAYLPNFYGITSSELHGALPTDRLVAAWDLRSPAVADRMAGRRPALAAGSERIRIPSRIADVPRDEALKIQARVREQFLRAFGEGLRVTGFERAGGEGLYHLARSE